MHFRNRLGAALCAMGAAWTFADVPDYDCDDEWRGLCVLEESSVNCEALDGSFSGNRDSLYGTGYRSREDDLVDQLGAIVSPYDGHEFECESSTAANPCDASDVDHIVALKEAHDSGMCHHDEATRKAFGADIDNLTLAQPGLNRNVKSDLDAADWMPDRNRCWFAVTVVKVRRKYEMTIDQSEAEALEEVLSDCEWGIHLHPIPDYDAMKSRLR